MFRHHSGVAFLRIRETEHVADIGEHVRLGQIHHQSLDSTGIFSTKHHRTGVDGQRSAQTHNGMSERPHFGANSEKNF